MDFELSEEQKSLRALARDFCKREVNSDYLSELMKKENPKDRVPWDLLDKAQEVGLNQLCVPEKYGGAGADFLTRLIVTEEMGWWAPPIAFLLIGRWKFCADLAGGSEEQQDEFFPQIMDNPRWLLALAVTESEAGSDTMMPYDEPGAGMKTFAYKDGNEWVINGSKIYCTSGGLAELYIVSARTDKRAPISKGMSQFIVPRKTPGFSIDRINDMMSTDIATNADLLLENVRVPERYLLGEVNKGYEAFHSRRGAKLIWLGGSIGYSQRIYEYTKEFARTRIQGGKPIFEHKNIGPLVVEMGQNIDVARLACYRAAWEFDQETWLINPIWYNYANVVRKRMLFRNVEILLEVFGGMAIMKECPVEAYIRSAINNQHPGSTPIMNLIKNMEFIDEFTPTGRR